jgi:hypothetical protein
MGTRALAVVVLLCGILVGAGSAIAADWSFVPAVTAQTEFNSNLNYSFTAPASDYIFTLMPSAEFNYTTEISQLQGRLAATALHYLSNGQLDHIDQNYQINGFYQVAPRWKLSLNSAYIVDTTLQQELLTSGVIMTRTPRQSILAGPAVTYDVTERLAATLSYTFNQVHYQDPNFQNYSYQIVGLKLQYPLKDQKTLLVGNVEGRQGLYADGDSYRVLTAYLGATHKFSEKWEVNLFGGASTTFMDFRTQVLNTSQPPFIIAVKGEKVRQTQVTPFVNVFATRRWTNFNITFGYYRDESPSAYGSLSQVNRIYGTMNYNYSEKVSGLIYSDYYLTTQDYQTSSFKNDYFGVNAQLNYRITEKLTASPGYRFGLRDDISNGLTANVHSVYVMLVYSYPMHYRK